MSHILPAYSTPFSNGTLSLRMEILAIGARFPAVFTAAKSCSEAWFPVPDSFGQGIKAPVVPCGEGGHGSTFVTLRLNVCGTYSEIKEPEEIHHLMSSTTLLLCPFGKRGQKNICFLCWSKFMFKSCEWTEHQGNSESFGGSHFLDRVMLESGRSLLRKAYIIWNKSQTLILLVFSHKSPKNIKLIQSKAVLPVYKLQPIKV